MAIIRQIPWTKQPQGAAEVNGGVGWTAAQSFGTETGIAGRLASPTTTTTVASAPFAVGKTFTVVVVFCAPAASQALTEVFRLGAGSTGIRLDLTTSAAAISPLRWTLNGVVAGSDQIILFSPFTTQPVVSVISVNPTSFAVSSGLADAGQEVFNYSQTASIIAPSSGNVQIKGGSGKLYATVVLNREMSFAERADVVRAPWQLFAPRVQRIWAPVSTGGAYSITAQPGAYAVSGQSSTITRSRLLTGSAGSYAVSGQTATVSRSKLITASAGSYALSGQTATLLRSKLIAASAGAYTYSGQSATITYTPAGAYTLTAQAGAYAVTGRSATLTKSRVINASAGSYSLSGKAATITYSGAPAPSSLSGVYFDVLSGRLLVLRARN